MIQVVQMSSQGSLKEGGGNVRMREKKRLEDAKLQALKKEEKAIG